MGRGGFLLQGQVCSISLISPQRNQPTSFLRINAINIADIYTKTACVFPDKLFVIPRPVANCNAFKLQPYQVQNVRKIYIKFARRVYCLFCILHFSSLSKNNFQLATQLQEFRKTLRRGGGGGGMFSGLPTPFCQCR